jgi:hypothetical protein
MSDKVGQLKFMLMKCATGYFPDASLGVLDKMVSEMLIEVDKAYIYDASANKDIIDGLKEELYGVN